MLVGKADVQVHTAAGLIAEWLGHEARLQPMFVGHTLDQAFVTYAFINGLECVEPMLQRQLDLAWRVLGYRRTYRQALQRARRVEVIQKRLKLLQLVYAIDLWSHRAYAIGLQRRLRPTVDVALSVQQVKLQLNRHDRMQSIGFQPLDSVHQYVTRVRRCGGNTLGRVHAHLHLTGGVGAPGLQGQASRQGVCPTIGVGNLPDQACVFYVFTLHGQGENGTGQWPAIFVDRQQFVAMQQFAPWNAIRVDKEQLDAQHFRVGGQIIHGLSFIGKLHVKPLRAHSSDWQYVRTMAFSDVPLSSDNPRARQGKQRGQRVIQLSDQPVDIRITCLRTAQGHVVKRRDQDSAIDQIEMQRHLKAVVKSRLGLRTGSWRCGTELKFTTRAQLCYRPVQLVPLEQRSKSLGQP